MAEGAQQTPQPSHQWHARPKSSTGGLLSLISNTSLRVLLEGVPRSSSSVCSQSANSGSAWQRLPSSFVTAFRGHCLLELGSSPKADTELGLGQQAAGPWGWGLLKRIIDFLPGLN